MSSQGKHSTNIFHFLKKHIEIGTYENGLVGTMRKIDMTMAIISSNFLITYEAHLEPAGHRKLVFRRPRNQFSGRLSVDSRAPTRSRGRLRFLSAARMSLIRNQEQFYSWISPDDERDNRRRIHDPRRIKDLGKLIAGGHNTLLNQIDQYEVTIEQAAAAIGDLGILPDWRGKLDKASKLIADLPQEAMFEDAEEFLEKLDVILEQISVRRVAILAVKNEA